MTVIEILKQLIGFPTFEQNYDNDIKLFVIDLLKDVRKEVIQIPNTKNRSFVVKIKGQTVEKPPIVFLCHLDTVNPSGNWHTDPCRPVIKDGKIFGLGACDTKGSVACVLKTILNIDKKKLLRDIYLFFTSDEETTANDIKKIAKEVKIKNALVIAVEPFGNHIGIGQKGVLEIEIAVPGKSMHASNATASFNKKNNAIYKISKIINLIIKEQEAELSKRKKRFTDVSTINFGIIRGGTAVNSTADRCVLQVSYRLMPFVDSNAIYKKLLLLVRKIDKMIKVKILLNGGSFNSEGKAETEKIINVMNHYLKQVKTVFSRVWSEVEALDKNGNICLIAGAGNIRQAHHANEFVSVDMLDKFCNIFKEVIEKY